MRQEQLKAFNENQQNNDQESNSLTDREPFTEQMYRTGKRYSIDNSNIEKDDQISIGSFYEDRSYNPSLNTGNQFQPGSSSHELERRTQQEKKEDTIECNSINQATRSIQRLHTRSNSRKQSKRSTITLIEQRPSRKNLTLKMDQYLGMDQQPKSNLIFDLFLNSNQQNKLNN